VEVVVTFLAHSKATDDHDPNVVVFLPILVRCPQLLQQPEFFFLKKKFNDPKRATKWEN